MGGVIKSKDAAAAALVRPVPLAPRPVAAPSVPVAVSTPPDPELVSLRAEVQRLQERVGEQAGALEAAEANARSAYDEGLGQGRLTGLKEAEDGRKERLAALRNALADALAALAGELGALERLAPLLAREALAKMMGDPGVRTELTAALVREQAAKLGAQAILKVQVSPDDFPDAEALASLSQELGDRGALALSVEPHLAAGQCRLKLALGEMEIGLRQQWNGMAAILTAMAEPGTAP